MVLQKKRSDMSSEELVFGVSDFVAVFNQTLEFAYPSVTIVGELSDFRVSKNRWLYFDLKDENAKVKFFGTVYNLPGPLEDGMMLEVRGQPRLHPLYGFSVSIQSIRPVGEGSIRKAVALLEAKLAKEGLFDEARKRQLPYPPEQIGLITAKDSAAYHDFVKILGERWGGVKIIHIDAQVQGELAIGQITEALAHLNATDKLDAIVITRGGGSLDDLAVFNTEPIVRAIATSRVPTLVAIGHEIDISLAELAADKRASTPTSAAQLLVPDKNTELTSLINYQNQLSSSVKNRVTSQLSYLQGTTLQMRGSMERVVEETRIKLSLGGDLLTSLSPQAAMKRGYAVLKQGPLYIKSVKQIHKGQRLTTVLWDGQVDSTIDKIN